MEGYFWGCALKIFSEKLTNVTEFRCEKKRDWGQTRRFIKIAMTAFNLTEHGRDKHKSKTVNRPRQDTPHEKSYSELKIFIFQK